MRVEEHNADLAKAYEQLKQEIEARKHAEQALRETEEKYKFIVDNSKEITLILSKTGKILFANRTALTSFGYSEEEIIGESITRFLAKESLKKAISALAQEFLGRPQPEMEIRIKAKSGEIRYLELVDGSAPVYEKGKLIGVMVSGRDITEARNLKNTLAKSEEHLEELLSYSPTVAYRCEPRGHYSATFITPNVKRQIGYEAREFTENPEFWAAHIHSEDAPRVFSGISDLFKKGYHTHEYRFLHKDGSYRWVHDQLRLTRDADGNPADIVGNWIDITEQKEAVEALRESEVRYRAIFENNPIRTIVVDGGGKITGFNQATKNSGDRLPDIGDVMYRDYAGKHKFDMHARLMKSIRSGRLKRFKELRYRNKILSVTIAPFPGGAITTSEDITEIKRAEEQTRRSLAMLQTVFDGIRDPLFTLEKDLSVKMFNQAARKYFQVVDPENVLGKPCYKAFRGRSVPCKGCKISSVVSSGKGGTFEGKGIMNSGISEKVAIYPLKEEGSRLGAAIIQITDTTEARQIERQLMQSEKLASLGLLVSGVAHEINNPNSFISFNIPILRDYLRKLIPIIDDYAEGHQDFRLFGMSYPEFREDIFKLLENMEYGSHRINATVSGLKEFTQRRDRGGKRWVNLKEVIERGVDICRSQIKKMVKTLEVSIPEDLPPIFTDFHAIEQVLINLLGNAGQAADKEDSWVRINVAPGKTGRNDLMIEVKDNGCGMDDETIRKIYDPFFTTKAPGTGTGLGLYVCHNLIEELGGRIEVKSDPGKGSTFRVILPNVKGEGLET